MNQTTEGKTMPDSKIVAIIQARMGSTRCPGKVMEKIGDKTVLEHCVDNALACSEVDMVIVAYPSSPGNHAIKILCYRNNYCVYPFHGDEKDVLSRYFKASTSRLYSERSPLVSALDHDTIVRLTSDNPFLFPGLLTHLIKEFLAGDYEYAKLGPDGGWPMGWCAEIFTSDLLKEAHLYATNYPWEREHVTPYMYVTRKQKTRLLNVESPYKGFGDWRLTVDALNDLEFARAFEYKIMELFGQVSLPSALKIMESHPELKAINAGVRQKPFYIAQDDKWCEDE